MKKIVLSIFTFFLLINCFAQTYSTKYNVVKLQETQDFYLNSGGRLGGKQRTTFKIDLPQNTIMWYYSFTTTPNENQIQSTNLFDQLSKIVSSPAIQIGKIATETLFRPTGSGVIDIYLTDVQGNRDFMATDVFNSWKYTKPNNFQEGSRENTKQGVVKIDDVQQGTVYLCFRNPSMNTGINITFEVVAIVQEQGLDNTTWSEESKTNLYNGLYENFKNNNIDENTAKELASCVIDNIALQKTPEELWGMLEGTRSVFVNGIATSCIEKYQPKKTSEQQKGVTFGNLGWKAYENGDVDKAIEYSKKALTIDNSLGYVKANLGLFYLIKDKEMEATEYYVDAISDFNKDKISAKRSFEAAITDIREGLTKYPNIKNYGHIKALLEEEIKKY